MSNSPILHATGMNEHSSNKSGTIEMYAPSSYNETMTGETLSSVSEKSETYSDTRSQDEKKRNGGNAYMIEQIDYPFQYPGYDTHPKEHNSIGHHRNPYITHNGTGKILFNFSSKVLGGQVQHFVNNAQNVFNAKTGNVSIIQNVTTMSSQYTMGIQK